jgi:lysophospholipase L1-like esterase
MARRGAIAADSCRFARRPWAGHGGVLPFGMPLTRYCPFDEDWDINHAGCRCGTNIGGSLSCIGAILPAIRSVLFAVMLLGFQWGAALVRSAESGGTSIDSRKKTDRIVFLGDSITDGDTYPLLLRQALVEADRPEPICVNAGVGGDTAAGMLKRLDRDVLARRPTLVTLSAGINDALHNISETDYQRDVTAIAERMKKAKVRLMILTTTILGDKQADADRLLSRYNQVLHDVAQRYDCPLADVNHVMHDARAAGKDLLEEDGIHPNFEGHRLIARAILDALGDNDVPVPAKMKVELMPGVLRDWKVQLEPDNAVPLDQAAAAAVKLDATWKAYPLPEPGPAPHWWREQERRRGFAVSLEGLLGKARSYRAITTIDSPKHRFAFLNPGAALETIWLNGKRVYAQGPAYAGWHAGRARVRVELQAGANTVLIETGQNFFLSLTDDDNW